MPFERSLLFRLLALTYQTYRFLIHVTDVTSFAQQIINCEVTRAPPLFLNGGALYALI